MGNTAFDALDDMAFLRAFEDSAIPPDEWDHRAHVRTAYLYTRSPPFDIALAQIRNGIQRLNAANGVEESETSGYHETVTVAWARIVEATCRTYGPTDSDFEQFAATHPHLLAKTLLRVFYSRDRIASPTARREFVEPDLSALPVSNGAKNLL